MNIDYNNATIVSMTKHFNGVTKDNRKFLIQSDWTKNGWKIDMIIWFNNDGDKETEADIKAEFYYKITNSN
jgi:hypothetical protein